MRKLSCAAIVALFVLGFVASAAAAVAIDGIISTGEWDGQIIIDPDDNPSNNIELTRWGAKVEGSHLYWFCEVGDGVTFDMFKDHEADRGTFVFPAIWIDFDHSVSTYLKDETPNCADDSKKEWATNHRGIDLNIEWGSDMYDTGNYVNYWGKAGDVGVVIEGGANATWSMGVDRSSNVIECKVNISDIAAALALAGNPEAEGAATMEDYWLVAVGIQGRIKDGYGDRVLDYGYDVGTPTAIAADPINKPLIPGDFNLDGTVDELDAVLLAANFLNEGAHSWMMGDANRDANADDIDAVIMAANWNASNVASVPEPSSLVLLLLLAIAAVMNRVKRSV